MIWLGSPLCLRLFETLVLDEARTWASQAGASLRLPAERLLQLQMLTGYWQETLTLGGQGGNEGRVYSGEVSVSILAHPVNALLNGKLCTAI